MWHRHDWKAIASHKVRGGAYFNDSEDDILTVMLYRCAKSGCGRFKTKILQGHWEPEELGIENTQERRGRKPLLQ